MTDLAISQVGMLPKTEVSRAYHRVAGANVLVYTPQTRARGAEGLMVVSMHGGLNPSLESTFLKAIAEYGVQTAFCVPDKSSFIDQFQSMDACMALFRKMADTVVLMGQSRGAALMSAYQKIAENGAQVFQGRDCLLPLPDMQLSPADGLMLLDANFGTTVMHLMSINPSVVETADGFAVEPSLDPLRPENGYASDGKSAFPEEFKTRFLAAQRARYYALLEKARVRLRAIERGQSAYGDNEPFVVAGSIGINNVPKLFASDLNLLGQTAAPWPLIHPDGSITRQIVKSVRRDQNNPGFPGNLNSAYATTVKDYLWSAVAVSQDYDYGRDYLSGIDFESSFTCSSGNVAMISCPLLLMGHTGGYEFIAAEWSYQRAASADKSIAFLEGATHGWTPVDATYGDTLGLEARFVIKWLTSGGRFVASDRATSSTTIEAPLSVVDVSALKSGLAGLWRSEETGTFARFGARGDCEVSFVNSWSQYDIGEDGALQFFDRYGGTSVLRLSSDFHSAEVNKQSYHLKGDRLCLQGVTLSRMPPVTHGGRDD